MLSMESHSRHSLLTLALFSFLLLFISINSNIHTTSATSSSSAANKLYVKKSCNSTLYPQVCYKRLSSYSSKIKSDPKKLCKYAIYVAYNDAKTAFSTASNISKTKGLTDMEEEVMKDCVDNIEDSVESLKDSGNAIDDLIRNGTAKSEDEKYQTEEDVKTWVSAALTDDDTCSEELDEEKVSPTRKKKLKKAILKVAKSTSIALAFINGYFS